MLKSLKIENFRCFQNFELQQLGRINLLVGTNNSGKTSVLEAIQLLCSGANLEKLRAIMNNRGEYLLSEDNMRDHELDIRQLMKDRELDIRQLFYGHDVQLNSQFSISSTDNDDDDNALVISVKQKTQSKSDDLSKLELRIEWIGRTKETTRLTLSPNAGLSVEYIRGFFYREARSQNSEHNLLHHLH